MRRRDGLKLIASAGLATLGGAGVYQWAPWINYAGRLERLRKPLHSSTNREQQNLEMVRFATLAASGHNAQPWMFAISQDSIEIRPDFTRALSAVDPHHRELWISLGCALENLLLAARSFGYQGKVSYPTSRDSIQVALVPEKAEAGPLLVAIPTRQNTRGRFDSQKVPTAQIDQIQKLQLEPGVHLELVSDLESLVDYIHEGNLRQFEDQAFVKELLSWIRFNKREAMASSDGLYTSCSGELQVPRWIGERLISNTNPADQAKSDTEKLRSSAGAFVIASLLDDKTSWVRSGQVYQRLALHLTSLGIQSAFLNQPIEVESLRTQLQKSLQLGSYRPQLLLRFGYAPLLPFSLRRRVGKVLVER
jgi:hypothetical protein